jgi:[NiFe] hydrogenase assembly HybE family chaperone
MQSVHGSTVAQSGPGAGALAPEAADDAALAARVQAMLAQFARVDETMRGLPFYNDVVTLEALGFRRTSEGMMGVLITPWCMNLMLLPDVPDLALDWNRMGEKRLIDLPEGPKHFLYGGDEALGVWWMHSLASPMDRYKLPGQARAAARQRLLELFTAPEPETPVAQTQTQAQAQTQAQTQTQAPALDRRALLRGKLSAKA